jgi:hypothetical protein
VLRLDAQQFAQEWVHCHRMHEIQNAHKDCHEVVKELLRCEVGLAKGDVQVALLVQPVLNLSSLEICYRLQANDVSPPRHILRLVVTRLLLLSATAVTEPRPAAATFVNARNACWHGRVSQCLFLNNILSRLREHAMHYHGEDALPRTG